jgi:hypothetical protein
VPLTVHPTPRGFSGGDTFVERGLSGGFQVPAHLAAVRPFPHTLSSDDFLDELYTMVRLQKNLLWSSHSIADWTTPIAVSTLSGEPL